MSIISRTPNMGLTQWDGDIAIRAGLYSRYNLDMSAIDTGFHTLDEAINGEEGLVARVTALETSVGEISDKADNAVATANEAKETADGMSDRVTAVEGRLDAYDLWKVDVDNTLTAYDGRLDAIEEVIETVSTANINDLIARMDALEQKVDANTQSIDTLNDNLIGAVNRITDLEAGLGTTNANLNALTGRVSLLEGCCEDVRTTLADHNSRINQNAGDISALDARLTRDETNIAGNASDITILATQNNTQAGQIDDLYQKYNALDPASPSSLISRVTTLEGVVGDTPLQTTAQTVTGAINELLGQTTDVDADEVEYDNSTSGMTATDVQGAIDELHGDASVEGARIDALETVVGGAGSGLVKDVSDISTSVGALETTVGDSNSGLVKDVADLGTSVGALETTVGDNTAGLVKDVADLQTTVGDATAGLVKDVADNGDAIGDLTQLSTTVKTDLVSAINEVDTQTTDTYSTSEVKTNKVWIDGKPIYRKVFVYENGTSVSEEIPIANLDTVIGYSGNVKMSWSASQLFTFPMAFSDTVANLGTIGRTRLSWCRTTIEPFPVRCAFGTSPFPTFALLPRAFAFRFPHRQVRSGSWKLPFPNRRHPHDALHDRLLPQFVAR